MGSNIAQVVENTELMQAQTHIIHHVCSFVNSMSLKCAVQLGIPDIIHNYGKPMPLSNLVEALSLPPQSKSEAVYRLMRLLVHSGFFACQKIDDTREEEGFLLTPSSRLLLKDDSTKYSMSSYVINMLNPALLNCTHFLSAWFQGSGSTTFEAAHGMTFWNFMAQHPEYGKSFDEAMATDSRLLMGVTVNVCKAVFENLRSLVDVGGGTGTAAQAIAEAFPHLKCTILDLPNVVPNLPATGNLEFIGGDMFESIPSANAVLLKNVLHDWGDDDCVKILKRCRDAIPSRKKGGKVILIEIVLEDRKHERETTETQLFFDVLMFTAFTSKERSEKDWKKLFLESGFTDHKITPIPGFRSLIEVYP